jgi:tetratricopeptide (TPR) repeat protein
MPRLTRLVAVGLLASIGIAACDDGQPAGAAAEQRNSYGAYLSALHADRQNQAARAARAFAVALKANPNNVRLRRLTFYASARAGLMDQAIALAKQIAAVEPGYMPAAMVMVVDAMKRGDFKGALERADKLPAAGSLGFLRTMARAWALVGAGEPEKALAEVDKLKPRRGLRVFYSLHRGLILDVLKREKEAADWYRTAHKAQSAPAVRFIQAAVTAMVRAGDKTGALKIIKAYETTRGSRFAIAHLRRRIENDDDLDPIATDAKEGFAELLMNLASALDQRRTARPGLMWAQASLYLRPENGASLYQVGDIQRNLRQHTAAIETLGKIKTQDALAWEAGKSIATSLVALKRNQEAEKLLEEMATRENKRWDVLAMLGNLYRSERKWVRAAKAFDRAIGRIGPPREGHWNLFFARGVAFERSKQWPKAEKDFRMALKLRPNQPSVLNYLAYSWVDRKENLKEALAMLRKAVSLRRRDGAIIDSLGWAYFRLGQFGRAVRLLERAAALEPSNWEINDHLGDAYWRTGRITEARHQWRRAMSMKPDKAVLAKIKVKLANGLPALKPSEPTQ